MIKRTVEISREPFHLAVQFDQLQLIHHEPQSGIRARIPCEDIGLVVVDHAETTYSHAALARLVEFGAGVVICGRNHLPAGLLLPLPDHTEVVWRINEQINVSRPLCKQLWQQLVTAKIRAQASNLQPQSATRRRLLAMAGEVRSGDPANAEAQAAKLYWAAWLPSPGEGALVRTDPPAAEALRNSPSPGGGEGRDEGAEAPAAPATFHRDPQGTDALNAMLNYGYAILRAAVARALVSAGLFPAIGLHHSNRSNAFCLADDLLEPLRPMVDRAVRRLHLQGQAALDPIAKKALLELLTRTVRLDGQTGPLMVALHRTVASLVRCYRGEDKRLLLPEMLDEVG